MRVTEAGMGGDNYTSASELPENSSEEGRLRGIFRCSYTMLITWIAFQVRSLFLASGHLGKIQNLTLPYTTAMTYFAGTISYCICTHWWREYIHFVLKSISQFPSYYVYYPVTTSMWLPRSNSVSLVIGNNGITSVTFRTLLVSPGVSKRERESEIVHFLTVPHYEFRTD